MFANLPPIYLHKKIKAHASEVTSIDYFDGMLASCSSDKTVRLWNQKEDTSFREISYSPLLGHTYGVNCVRFSPLGVLLASCSTDGKVILWNAVDGEKVGELQHASNNAIRVCTFSPTSNLFATGGDDEKVVLWDITTKTMISIFLGHEAMVTALAFSPDSLFLISCSSAGDLLLWDARFGHGKYLCSVSDAHDLGVNGCDFSPQYDASAERGFLSGNYTAATCGNDDTIKIWFIKTGTNKSIELVNRLRGHTGNVLSCRFSSDGTWLVSTAGDKQTILWNPNTGVPQLRMEGHERYVTCSAFINPNLIATGSNDKQILMYSLAQHNLSNLYNELDVAPGTNSISHQKKTTLLLWTVNDVCEWLVKIKLGDLVSTFLSHDIDGKELIHLTHENMIRCLQVESYGKRNKLLRAIQCLKNPLWHHVFQDLNNELALQEFYCPITHEIMRNPFIAADGYSYEKGAIEAWLDAGNDTSPMTNAKLAHKELLPNHVLFQLIHKYK